MKDFIIKYNFYLFTTLGIAVGIYVIINWDTMPVLQRLVGLFFTAIILHLWEESKYPGGFTEMITKRLNFTQKNPHFGEFVTGSYILLIVFVPLLFPEIAFLSMAALLLGVLEVFAHLAAIRMYDKSKYYSPGLVTAVVVLLPISVYAILYVSENDLIGTIDWLYSILYMFGSLMFAQQLVVRMSGMKYSDFLKNVKGALFSTRK